MELSSQALIASLITRTYRIAKSCVFVAGKEVVNKGERISDTSSLGEGSS